MLIHLANTDAEFEYANRDLEKASFIKSWSKHSLCLQLQYLPLLYAEPEDLVAVTSYPDDNYLSQLLKTEWGSKGIPAMMLIEDHRSLEGGECLSWGHSKRVKRWAQERNASYAMPDAWEKICLINSKAFSFRFSILKEAALIENEIELIRWLAIKEGSKVLKTCYGLSGIGNHRVDENFPTPALLKFCRKEWIHRRAIIGEPWLDKVLDFSTQWKIDSHGRFELIGATRFETDHQGNYQGTVAGEAARLFSNSLDFLHQHIEFIQKPLQEIAEMGFFGNIGFDAFLYRDNRNQIHLQPLVEINGRKTMSLVALMMQRKHCPDRLLKFSFNRIKQSSLLPEDCLNEQKERIYFRYFLTASILD